MALRDGLAATETLKQSERGQCQDRKRAAKSFSKSPPLMDSGDMRKSHPERLTASVCHWHERAQQLFYLSVRTPRLVHRHRYRDHRSRRLRGHRSRHRRPRRGRFWWLRNFSNSQSMTFWSGRLNVEIPVMLLRDIRHTQLLHYFVAWVDLLSLSGGYPPT